MKKHDCDMTPPPPPKKKNTLKKPSLIRLLGFHNVHVKCEGTTTKL